MATVGIPVISFLHVPGKMSQPLWLMMGTAFRVALPCNTATPLFLTAKHTFMPWDYVKDASSMKIPEEFRKLRYVVGRAYGTTPDGRAEASQMCPMSLVATHPTLDVAVLRTSVNDDARATPAAAALSHSAAVSLCPSPLQTDTTATISGFRGMGTLGELDTFDPSLLDKLPAAERDKLLKELQSVEGKQVSSSVSVRILDGRGMCQAIQPGEGCFHGMSGGPLLVDEGDHTLCAGILYGKHPDAPTNIGYTPANEILEWVAGVAGRVKSPDASK